MYCVVVPFQLGQKTTTTKKLVSKSKLHSAQLSVMLIDVYSRSILINCDVTITEMFWAYLFLCTTDGKHLKTND